MPERYSGDLPLLPILAKRDIRDNWEPNEAELAKKVGDQLGGISVTLSVYFDEIWSEMADNLLVSLSITMHSYLILAFYWIL